MSQIYYYECRRYMTTNVGIHMTTDVGPIRRMCDRKFWMFHFSERSNDVAGAKVAARRCGLITIVVKAATRSRGIMIAAGRILNARSAKAMPAYLDAHHRWETIAALECAGRSLSIA